MTEQELKDMIDAEVAKVAPPAAKADETVTQTAQPEVAAQTATYTQEQIDAAVKGATEQAVKAASARFEQAYKAAQRPAYAVNVTHSEAEWKANAAKATPFAWAWLASYENRGGKLLFDLRADGGQGITVSGDTAAVKAFNKLAAKAMVGTIGSATGEHFVPHIQSDIVINALYEQIISRRLRGVRVYPMGSDVVDAPTMTAFTAGWSAQGSASTVSGDATTSRKQLIAKELTGWVEASNALLETSVPEIERYLRDGLTGAMAEAYDTAVLFTASANSPTPISSTAGVASTAIDTDDVFTAIVKALGRMATNKVRLEQVNVIIHPLVAVKTATTRAGSNGDFLATASAAGQPIVGSDTDMLASMVQRRLGIPVFTTSLMPVASSTSSIYVINGAGLVLGDRKTLEISSSNVAGDAFKNNLTYFKAILRGDVMLQRGADLEIITGVAH